MGFKPKKHLPNPRAQHSKRDGVLTVYLAKPHMDALLRGERVEYGSLTPREISRLVIELDR